MRYLITALQTVGGALAGSCITLGVVGQFVLGADSEAAALFPVIALVLAGLSAVCAALLVALQRPRRTP